MVQENCKKFGDCISEDILASFSVAFPLILYPTVFFQMSVLSSE
jgi:hypothetical protein